MSAGRRTPRLLLLLSGPLFFANALLAGAETKEVVLQQGLGGYDGCRETRVREDKGQTDSKRLNSGHIPGLCFDLGTIPRGSRVDEATLSLYVVAISPESRSFEMPIYQWVVRRMTPKFPEFSEAVYGVHLASAHPSPFRGGMRIPGVPEGKIEKEGEWVHWDLREMAQCWVDRPEANHGLLVVGNDGRKNRFHHRIDLYPDQLKEFYGTRWNPSASGTRRTGTVDYASGLWEVPASRPKLRILYGPSPPEPRGTAKEAVFQQGLNGYAGCTDTEIDEDRPGPRGAETTLTVHRVPDGTWTGKFARPLLRFDLTAIQKEAAIVKAELGLYCLGGERGDKRGAKRLADVAELPQEPAMYHKTPVWLARMITDWDETATLQTPRPGGQWQIPKLGAGYDFYAPPTWLLRDYMTVPGLAKAVVEDYGQWYNWDITEFAQEWVRSPEKNRGVVLLMSGLCMFHKHLEDLTEADMAQLFAPPDKGGPRNVHERMWLLNNILWKKPSFENLEQQDYLRFATSNGPPETRPRLHVSYME